VERRRRAEPYHLTSTMVGMGSLISEGDHLYLDRTREWRAGLRLVLEAARTEEDRAGAAGIVLRDLPDGDQGLHAFLVSEGFIRIPVLDTWVRDLDFGTDDEFLAGLTRKARYHQRTNVLAWEPRYDVEVVHGGGDAGKRPAAAELDHLYGLSPCRAGCSTRPSAIRAGNWSSCASWTDRLTPLRSPSNT
jgi:hypothetical protein